MYMYHVYVSRFYLLTSNDFDSTRMTYPFMI